ncbi:hypothetical protein [Cognatishimia sp. WU-CL00825]|uniref:hypothetical protein n=1 Tax=Cognatishimia sp. WU-CL00825 TaxID=3127658 RepID=UPI0033654BB6
MHSWFTKKLDDMIELARYCNFPILQAHFLMSQRAVETMYQSKSDPKDALAEILPLLISHAKLTGQVDVQNHLESALRATKTQPLNASKVISIDFRAGSHETKPDHSARN